MNRRRLIRSGVFRVDAGGCAAIEVSVPCTACRAGSCGNSGRRQLIELHETAVTEGAAGYGSRTGEQVEISIAAAGLNGMCLKLFGPAIVWIIGFALAGSIMPIEASIQLVIGVVGLLGTLAVGRNMAQPDDLEIRVAPQDI